MNRRIVSLAVVAAAFSALAQVAAAQPPEGEQAKAARQYRMHDYNRPRPAVIQPGTASTPDQPGKPPSDAIVLFDGTDLSQWRSMDGSPAKWVVKNGNMECVRGSGYIRSLQAFGDCQLHVEWAAPAKPEGRSQGRGNSGVFLMGNYEVQVLDSYENITYADGQAAAVYGQYPPQVNASRSPGQWQTYDIVFHRPHFDEQGKLLKRARLTVVHNGVLVQDNVELLGPTTWMNRPEYTPHPDKLPLSLQDHGNPVLYRNIWVRELPAGQPHDKEITLGGAALDKFAGQYKNQGLTVTVTRKGDQLLARIGDNVDRPIYPRSETEFFSKYIGLVYEFKPGPTGQIDGLTIKHGDDRYEVQRAK